MRDQHAPIYYGSVCSGIEAATMALHNADIPWKARFLSEIESFPCAVLRHRYPDIPLHGDFTTIKEQDYGPVDVLCGGTPCQSFSIAGKRLGLDDPRGNLALEFIAVAKRVHADWILWENVPGVLSSWTATDDPPRESDPPNDMEEGEERVVVEEYEVDEISDFGSFLSALVGGGYSCAWRVLDAQYFGLAQRRERVFLVAHTGDWQRAAAILFEPESMSGNPPPSREKRKDSAGIPAFGIDEECNATADQFGPLLRGGDGGTRQAVAYKDWPAEVAPTLRAGGYNKSHANSGNWAGVFDPNQITSKANRSQPSPEISHTLPSQPNSPVCFPINTQIALRHQALGERTGMGIGDESDPSFTIQANHCHAVAVGTLTANGVGTCGADDNQAMAGHLDQMPSHMPVRRLTEVECERLMGFPDNFTRIPYKNKSEEQCPMGPRYKALGNSWAVPCAEYIFKRMDHVIRLTRHD